MWRWGGGGGEAAEYFKQECSCLYVGVGGGGEEGWVGSLVSRLPAVVSDVILNFIG